MKSNLAKNLTGVLALSLVLSIGFSSPTRAEDWKGKAPSNKVTAGLIQGFAPVTQNLGYSLLGHVGYQIFKDGWLKDVADTVFVETELGGHWTNLSSYFYWSVHLRWDFFMNDRWALFGLAGFSGYTSPIYYNAFLPRVGVGVLYQLQGILDIRAEFGRDLVGVGVQFPLYL